MLWKFQDLEVFDNRDSVLIFGIAPILSGLPGLRTSLASKRPLLKSPWHLKIVNSPKHLSF